MARNMAYIGQIRDISPILSADSIELAWIEGWSVVVRKNEFSVGQKVIYIQIDSWVPQVIAPFLCDPEKPKEYKGVVGARLKQKKIRGAYSAGLILPLFDDMIDLPVGHDLTDALNIQKFEVPDEFQNSTPKGDFPKEIPKTDQTRIQDLFYRIRNKVRLGEIIDEWYVQEKLEGSSMQVAYVKGANYVLSRNCCMWRDEDQIKKEVTETASDLQLSAMLLSEYESENTFTRVAKRDKLSEFTTLLANTLGVDVLSLQGELIGHGIQKNYYGMDKHEFRLFDVFAQNRYLSVPEIMEILSVAEKNSYHLNAVPMQRGVVAGIFSENNENPEHILELARIKSSLNTKKLAEGLVFKNVRDPSVTFKAINQDYSMKE
jgi:RNA ligase (TIGR02306 family)